MAWTDEMVEKLKEYWAQGVTTGEIGKRLGISKNSIVGKVHRLGLEGRPSPIKRTEESSSSQTTKKTEKKPVASKSETKKAKTAKTTAEPQAQSSSQPEPKKQKDKPVAPKTPVVEKTPITPQPSSIKPIDKKLDEQIEEEDIKLIKSLEIKPEKDYRKENISLTDLDNHTCRWPLGDPKAADFHFCGRKVKTGQTYCEEHAAIAYVKPVRR